MQLLGNPGSRTSGELTSWAWSSQFFKETFSFEERVGTYASEDAASQAFAAAKDVLGSCTRATAEYPQEGTVILGDGVNRLSVETSKVITLPNGVLLPEASDYSRDMQAVVLAGRSVISMSFVLVPDEMSRANAVNLATSVAEGAFAFATAGSLPEPVAAAALDSLGCLQLEVYKVDVLENYSDWAGKGNGEDLFIDTQLKATNNCSKAVRGYSYDIEFKDEFDEYLLGGNGDVRESIQPGKSRLSPANRGWQVRKQFDPEKVKIFTSVPIEDLTITPAVTKILFTDKTTLP